MKRILIAEILLVFIGCKEKDESGYNYSWKIGKTTIGNIGFKEGDTVLVQVLGHGGQAGIIRKIYKGDYYMDFFNCVCNGWYHSGDIMPYSEEWNKLNKELNNKYK